MSHLLSAAPRYWKHGGPGYDTRPPTRREVKSSSVVTLFLSGNSLAFMGGTSSQHVASITPQDRTIFLHETEKKEKKKIKGKTAQPPFSLRFAFSAFCLSARALSPEHNLLD